MANNELLKALPKVDDILKNEALKGLEGEQVLISARKVIGELRVDVLNNSLTSIPDNDYIASLVLADINKARQNSLKRVINGTGIIIHTNLGRSCLSDEAAQAVYDVAKAYSTLEYDIDNKCRGSRLSHVEGLLKDITGAEGVCVVNNNAAAVYLTLLTLLNGKEVIVSRGELVEIGGSFRIPEIMEQSGAILREVGTTNKTHIKDYENKINENTGALLKVHTSNYKIIGFTDSVALDDIVEIAHKNNLLAIEDLGSGAIYPMGDKGIDEPCVQKSLESGVDIVCFSGDKLFGGPQAGIILGNAKLIEKLKKHPLMRVLRLDKMTLSALEVTLRHYKEGQAWDKVPTLNMINQSPQILYNRAKRLCDKVNKTYNVCAVVETESKVGGGSAPETELPSFGVSIEIPNISADEIEEALRLGDVPIIGRIFKDKFVLDMRTVFDEDIDYIAETLCK
ncbi:MAG: L-seryl-tRNA(Sec) selenium transferase [Christensenellaceae bacterium]|nr:L-seryl-tRNA(Sec) selenium transferase [Christensenellaceae bacterium]